MKEVIFLNGRFVLSQEAKVSVLEPGFLCGWGLFETMRAYRGRIVYLGEHLKRLKNSCRLIKMECPYSVVKLKRIIEKTVKFSNFKDAYVRLTLWKSEKGTKTLIVSRRYRPYSFQKYRRGFRLTISRFRQNEDSMLAAIKTTSRLWHEISFKEAKDRSFDEALILNTKGYIAEASRGNIFLVRGNTLFTPALKCGCLEGITRKAVFALAKRQKIKVYEGNLTAADLYQADEAFLTNSLMGIMPLVALEKKLIGRGRPGRLTQFLMRGYNSLLKNET